MQNRDPIQVLIVDDHGMVRKGLQAYLIAQADINVIGECKNGLEAVKFCEDKQPDVILMDLVMPGLDGAEATRAIREKRPEIQIIALTSFQEQDLIQEVLQAGAIGYLLKDVTGVELADAIRSVKEGKPILSADVLQTLVRPPVKTTSDRYELTERELEVLGLLVEGLNNPQIAQKLFISRSTVKVHVSNLLAKLGVSNRAEAVSIALQNKIID